MATRTTVTSEGVTAIEVPDGVSVLPEALQEQAQEIAATTNATDELLSELLGDPTEEIVEPVEIFVGDKILKLGVRRLSQREISAILRKRMRSISGKLTPAADADIILKIHSLHECVRKNVGTPDAPQWVPLWKLEDVAGNAQKKGLIDNPSANASELIDGLLSEINLVNNNQLNAVFLEAMDKVLAEGARQALGSA